MFDVILSNSQLLLFLFTAGAFAGLIAGMFGVGGGVVIVPALFFVLSALGYDDTGMHVAVGTSLATIIATSVRSVLAHNKKGAVDWNVLKAWVPFIVLGSLASSLLSGFISGEALTAFFGVVAILLSAQFIFGRPGWKMADELPDGVVKASIGGIIGACSALMGIGGGVFGVTLMTLCGRPIHQAVGTAAGFGAAIGVPGAIGFIASGWAHEDLPPMSVGYLSLPGFIIIALLTTLIAPLGASLAHKLPAHRLKQAFGILMLLTAFNMLRKVWF